MAFFAGVLSLAACGEAVSAPAAWPIPAEVKTVEVDGYPLAYADTGTGPPVVVIHGAWVDYRLFLPDGAALAKQHRVVLVSLRHHYPEIWDGKGEAISFRRHGADVAGLVRALKLGKVHLVGHSMGGAVAIEVARSAPELLRTLVVADPGGPLALLGDEAAARQRAEAVSRLSTGIRAQLESGGGRASAAEFGWNSVAGSGAWNSMPTRIQQMFVDNIGTMAATPDQDPPGLECGEGRAFAFPVLLVHGERSAKFYQDLGAGLRKCRSGVGSPIVVPGAGHNMHVENSAYFNAALLEFFAKH